MCGGGLASFCTSATGAASRHRKTEGARPGYVTAPEETHRHCQGDECSDP